MSMGTLAPSRRMALDNVWLISRFSVSPNSYGRETPPDSTPVERSRVSWRPKLLRPSEPSRSRRVLKPRKSMALSVISKRASGLRSCALPNWPPGVVCGGGVICGGCCGLMNPSWERRSTSLSIRSRTSRLFSAPGSCNILRSSSLIASSGSRSPSCSARRMASRRASIDWLESNSERP